VVSRFSDNSAGNTSSALSAPWVPATGERVVSNWPPSNEFQNPGRSLATPLEMVASHARLTSSERQSLLNFLTSSDSLPPDALSDWPMAQGAPSSSSMVHGVSPDLSTVLDIISRAQLDPWERQALMTALSRSSGVDQLPLTGWAGEETTLPPPYLPRLG
jgi:hypothetical protein